MSLSLQPPRGTQDRFPEEYRIRSAIFTTWRRVCTSFGYEEYLGPLVEHADIWRAKSGEDVGGTELTLITDKEGNISDLAVRPEMTPTVTRMVARKYNELSKPIRRFSIANFYRNERPQRGRNREFRQLNFDMFGEESPAADLEILQMAIEIMLAFNPPKDSFVLSLNNRHLIDSVLLDGAKIKDSKKVDVIRLMDKREKMDEKAFVQAMHDIGLLAEEIMTIVQFMKTKTVDAFIKLFPRLADNEGFLQLQALINGLEELGYGEYVEFKPSLMRGFDYYDGMVFEVFDKHPDNNRAVFGGGRYNGLADIFGAESFPAVGCAPGDEMIRLFLESRGLVDQVLDNDEERRYLPMLDESLASDTAALAQRLRRAGKNIELGLTPKKFGKALQYADKKGCSHVVIFGSEEKEEGVYKVKEMKSGGEEKVRISN